MVHPPKLLSTKNGSKMAEKTIFGEEHLENTSSSTNNQLLLVEDDISYGASGFTGIFHSPYVFAAAFLASMGGFSFGYGR